ncbi:MAG: threonine synthase [Bacteroidota bacterium]
MELYSTNNPDLRAGLSEAIFQALPPDRGLYMPLEITPLSASFFDKLSSMPMAEMGFRICRHLFQGSIPDNDLKEIVYGAINFPAPLVKINDHIHVLELFHGPSLAFKDFGARFMARLMSYFNRSSEGDLVILVATSGDTGGAVAAGFYNTPGIQVVILYPKGKVSFLQEKQLTTLGKNITALEIEGTFDDCQALVKQAFVDDDLRDQIRISSANSINISRLIPQSFYYFDAVRQLGIDGPPIVFCIPSGNFGNLTAGLIAQRLGLPIAHFIAATNQNDVVPEYLSTGSYKPRPSSPTLSNAMDVGNPSNFMRMADLYGQINGLDPLKKSAWTAMQESISGYAFTDEETEEALFRVFKEVQYLLDPHGAVGYLAIESYLRKSNNKVRPILLETAHPAKFKPDVERIIGHEIEVPERLARLADVEKVATAMSVDYDAMRDFLLERYG